MLNMMGGKNVGVIAGGLFLAAMFYLSSSGLVTVVRAVMGRINIISKWLDNE